ncbi:MAG: hypothetical protein WBD00_04740, partial [Candidatus Omnitrophota bacterium]
PETSRRTLKGNHMTVRAFDAQGNPRPIFDEPGYKGGMEAKLYFLPRPENKKGRDALDGMVVTLVSRPEMPSGIMVPGPRIYNPTTTKAWKITLHNDLVRGTSGVIQLRLVRIVPRVDMTQPVGEALVPEVAPKTEFGRSVGANILGSFHDVGEWGGKHDGYSSPEGRAKLLKQMTELAANGSGIVRVQSFFGDARAGLQFDDQGRFTGFDDKVAADIQAFFDVLEEVRWDYPNFTVMPTLFSFELADGVTKEGGVSVGERPALMKDAVNRLRIVRELNRVLGSYWGHDGIYAWDLFNEPEGSPDPRMIVYVKRFVEKLAEKIHAGGGKVTVGSKNQTTLIEHWVDLDALDILQFHIYAKGIPVFDRTAAAISTKPIIIGEVGQRDMEGRGTKMSPRNVQLILDRAREMGYKGVIFWIDSEYGLQKPASIEEWLAVAAPGEVEALVGSIPPAAKVGEVPALVPGGPSFVDGEVARWEVPTVVERTRRAERILMTSFVKGTVTDNTGAVTEQFNQLKEKGCDAVRVHFGMLPAKDINALEAELIALFDVARETGIKLEIALLDMAFINDLLKYDELDLAQAQGSSLRKFVPLFAKTYAEYLKKHKDAAPLITVVVDEADLRGKVGERQLRVDASSFLPKEDAAIIKDLTDLAKVSEGAKVKLRIDLENLFWITAIVNGVAQAEKKGGLGEKAYEQIEVEMYVPRTLNAANLGWVLRRLSSLRRSNIKFTLHVRGDVEDAVAKKIKDTYPNCLRIANERTSDGILGNPPKRVTITTGLGLGEALRKKISWTWSAAAALAYGTAAAALMALFADSRLVVGLSFIAMLAS